MGCFRLLTNIICKQPFLWTFLGRQGRGIFYLGTYLSSIQSKAIQSLAPAVDVFSIVTWVVLRRVAILKGKSLQFVKIPPTGTPCSRGTIPLWTTLPFIVILAE